MSFGLWNHALILAGVLLQQASASDCHLGFALQGIDPFDSTDWGGQSVCGGSLVACGVTDSGCSTSSLYNCFWSIFNDGSDADDDGACWCQSCGGLSSSIDDYMIELSIWDRARCAIYALEFNGYNVTPCVEALVDDMAMPGVDDAWTAANVSRFECVTLSGIYSEEPGCWYNGTPRLATEVFGDNDTSTPTTGVTTSSAIAPTGSGSSADCHLGFALQGIDPFDSTDWGGQSVCGGSLVACGVTDSGCSTSSLYNCFWSIFNDGSDADDDGACWCQSCGGLSSSIDDYMIELSIWDRARCAIYALEFNGYNVTPCVEALVDDMAMPGVDDAWTAANVSRFECVTLSGIYSEEPGCWYDGTPRLATEVFGDNDTSTPTTGATTSSAIAPTGSGSSADCHLGFALQGIDPFDSTDWGGQSVCGGSLVACGVTDSGCSTSSLYNCFWSIFNDGSDADDDGACWCQSCGGLSSSIDDYMIELSIWDRARCAIYALEFNGYNVTPCVEALVDDMAMPGVDDAWTAANVSRFECMTLSGIYSEEPGCWYNGTPRLATEVFGDNDTSTPTPGATTSSAIAPTDPGSSADCHLGFALQGIDPFDSTDWGGQSVCGGSLVACGVTDSGCSTSSLYNCFWSIFNDGSDADDDGACWCQSCGGLSSSIDDYMIELSIWDRARCAIYALEFNGYNVTPCVEALVDDMAMPGVDDAWTAANVSRFECMTLSGIYSEEPGCWYDGIPRLATEVFGDNDTSTPAPGATTSPLPTPEIARTTMAPIVDSTAAPVLYPSIQHSNSGGTSGSVETSPSEAPDSSSSPFAIPEPTITTQRPTVDSRRTLKTTPAPSVSSTVETVSYPAYPSSTQDPNSGGPSVPVGESSSEASDSSSSTFRIRSDADNGDDGGNSPGNIADIAIGVASVVVAIIGIAVGVRYRTEIRFIGTGHHTNNDTTNSCSNLSEERP